MTILHAHLHFTSHVDDFTADRLLALGLLRPKKKATFGHFDRLPSITATLIKSYLICKRVKFAIFQIPAQPTASLTIASLESAASLSEHTENSEAPRA